MDKIIIRWQEYIFIILSRSDSRIHVRIFHLLDVWHKSYKLTAKLTSVRLHDL